MNNESESTMVIIAMCSQNHQIDVCGEMLETNSVYTQTVPITNELESSVLGIELWSAQQENCDDVHITVNVVRTVVVNDYE